MAENAVKKSVRTFVEMLLYKIDRSIAIGGVVAVTIIALVLEQKEVALGGIGVLGVYLGAKTTAKGGSPEA